jgi:hypothetical protein
VALLGTGCPALHWGETEEADDIFLELSSCAITLIHSDIKGKTLFGKNKGLFYFLS